jgi:hypothetical protein
MIVIYGGVGPTVSVAPSRPPRQVGKTVQTFCFVHLSKDCPMSQKLTRTQTPVLGQRSGRQTPSSNQRPGSSMGGRPQTPSQFSAPLQSPPPQSSRVYQHADTHLLGSSLSRQSNRQSEPRGGQTQFTFGSSSEKRDNSVHWMVHVDPAPGPSPRYKSTRGFCSTSAALESASVRHSLHNGVDTRQNDHHFAASGLGYGPGHRLFYRYVHKDWDPAHR